MLFAFLGLGFQELLILLFVGGMMALPALVAAAIVLFEIISGQSAAAHGGRSSDEPR